MAKRNKIFTSAPDSGKAYYDWKRNTYRKGCEVGDQPYYWWQGIGKTKGTPSDVLAHVAYVDETWQGIQLSQADLGILDNQNRFTVDKDGMLICTGNDCDKFSIDQSTAQLVYSG